MTGFTVTFTEQEGNALVQLLDLVAKAHGHAVQPACWNLDQKIRQAAKAAVEPPAPETKPT